MPSRDYGVRVPPLGSEYSRQALAGETSTAEAEGHINDDVM